MLSYLVLAMTVNISPVLPTCDQITFMPAFIYVNTDKLIQQIDLRDDIQKITVCETDMLVLSHTGRTGVFLRGTPYLVGCGVFAELEHKPMVYVWNPSSNVVRVVFRATEVVRCDDNGNFPWPVMDVSPK